MIKPLFLRCPLVPLVCVHGKSFQAPGRVPSCARQDVQVDLWETKHHAVQQWVGFLRPFENAEHELLNLAALAEMVADFQLGFGSAVPPASSQDFFNPFSSTFAVTDMVLQNPNGDTGFVQIKRDGNIIMQSALENFRDLDLHFVAPYMFNPGSTLTMSITCTTPGPTLPNCSISGSFGGFQK